MMNFAMMINLNEVKPQNGSLFNSSSKVSNLNKKSEFENMMIKKESLFNKNTNENDCTFNKLLAKSVEINIEDKEKLIKDLEEKLNDDYTREDIINIVNLYLTVNLVSNNKSLEIDSVEFVNITNELISEKSSLEIDILGVFELNDRVLSIPIIDNTLEYADKPSEVEFKSEAESIINNVNVIDNEINIINNTDVEDIEVNNINNIENSNEVNSVEFSYIEEIIREFENISKIDIFDKNSDYREIFKEIESIVQFNQQKENHLKVDSYRVLNSVKSDVFNKKDDDSIKIDELFDVKNIEFRDLNNLNDKIQEETNRFNDFLINQRVPNIKVKTLNTSDKDMNVLMEIVDSKSNIDVTNLINPDSSSFKSNINDTIKTSIAPESIRQSFIETDITQTIQYMRSTSINELTLKVKPKELGEVTINLVKNNDISDVVITVEREELFNSIKKNLIIINRELKDLGLKINNVSIEMKPNNIANSTFNFMSNSNGDNSKNQNNNYHQDKKLKKSIDMINDMEISDIKMSKNEVENEVNLLA